MKRAIFIFSATLIWMSLLSAGDSAGNSLTVEALADDPVLSAIDDALYDKVKLLDGLVDFPRPAREAEERLKELSSGHDADPRILKALADVQIRLLRFDEAEATMERLAAAHSDPLKGLSELAAFYHSRLKIGKEVEALRKLADRQEGDEKEGTLRSILMLKDNYLLENVDAVAVYRQMIAARPGDAELVKELISYLADEERFSEAITEADGALLTFPENRNDFLPLKADILRKAGREEEALRLYQIDFNPVEDLDLFNGYLNLLRSMDRYVQFERGLNRSARLHQLDERGFQQHFLLMRGQRKFNEAEKTLDRWIEQRGNLTGDAMDLFARAFSAIGKSVKAWQLAYSRYLVSSGAEEREDALMDLLQFTWDVRSRQLVLGIDGGGIYLGKAGFDDSPGVLGGLLSLLYNDQNLSSRIRDLDAVGGDFVNRAVLMRIIERLIRDYPQSPRLASAYSFAVQLFNEYHRPRLALEYAERFMNSFPEDEHFYQVAEAAIDSMRMARMKDRIEALYTELIRRADRRGERDDYSKYLSRLVQFHVGEKKLAKAVELYWQEITAHPKEESLYQRFLEFLGSHNIYEEELRVYQRAIDAFQKNDYYDKLARWYIRQRRQADFQDLTRTIADIFDESELSQFFGEFLRRGSNAANPDSIFYRTMFEYANRRFPRNLKFVEGLLNYYRAFKLWNEFDALSARYFYASERIRKDWLRRLNKDSRLEMMLSAVPGGSALAGTLEGKPMPEELPESPAELLFLGEAARWNSNYESAVPVFRTLASLYPGDESIVGTLASLRRSFGENAGSEELYVRLASIYPLDKKYPTAAGELSIESGDVDRAGELFRKIVEMLPSDQNRHLEVASIFWDYYYFDRSAETILAARSLLDDPTLFGSKLAAVYESAKDYPRAVAEYVQTVALNWNDYYRREEAMRRLQYLSERRGMEADIKAAYRAAIAAGGDHRYIQAFDNFLRSVKREEERIALLASAVDHYDNRQFLNWLVTEFRRSRHPDLEERTLRHLISLDGETPGNLLQLANFFERQKRLDEAEAILVKRIEMTRTEEPEALPDYVGALHDAAQFAWRHEQLDKAFGWWATAARASSGYQQRRLLHQLAVNYIAKQYYTEGAAILEELLAKEPAATDLFNTLARIYSDREDYRGLADLYRRGMEAVRNAPDLGESAKRARIESLRLGLIDNLKKLGDYTAALDQYIELINRNFSSYGFIQGAYLLAVEHQLENRLLDYYSQTAAKSFKDYRWNYVLARLFDLQNRLEDAVAQWQLAIANEPQRINLHEFLAETFLKLQRFDQAVEQYREIYRLDKRNSSWLITIARTLALAGDIDEAKATLDITLEQSPRDYNNYFDVARLLAEWGEMDAAAARMEEGLDVLRQNIYKQPLRASDLNFFLEVNVKRGRVMETFNTLLNLNYLYGAEANRKGNVNAWQARQGQDLTYKAFSGTFAEALKRYAADGQVAEVAASLDGFLTGNPGNQGSIDFVLQAAEEMNIVGVTERAIEAKLALLRPFEKRYDHRRFLLEELQFYQDRGMWREAIPLLERELSLSNYSTLKTNLLQILATFHRYGGDTEGEMKILRQYWRDTGGSHLRFNETDTYVERYLTLLLDNDRRMELNELLNKHNSYSGQVINFMLAHNRTDLAQIAIDAAALQRSPKWRDTKKLLVQTYFDLADGQMGSMGSPAELMQRLPIGRRLDITTDKERMLVGGEWYGFLRHYVTYLFRILGDDGFRTFLTGMAEGNPRSPAVQRAIARWFSEHDMLDDALHHYQLALQLPRDGYQTWLELGELHLKRGDKDKAMEMWNKLLENARIEGAFDAYLETLAEHGMLSEGIPQINDFIRKEFGDVLYWMQISQLNSYAARLIEYGDTTPLLNALFEKAESTEYPINFLSTVFYQVELQPEDKGKVLEKIVAAADRSTEVEGEDADDGVDSKLGYWLKESIEYAADNKLFHRAQEWVELFEARGLQEHADKIFGSDEHYLRLKGRVLLALGEKEAALAALIKSLKPENSYAYELSSYQAVYKILMDGGADAEAGDLIIGFYREMLLQGSQDSTYYAGLADELLRRASREGRQEDIAEALKFVDRLVNLRPNNADGMKQAAELLEKGGLYDEALNYRLMLMRLDPFDYVNKLMVAQSYSGKGRREDALAIFRELFTASGVSRNVKMRAVGPYAALFADNPSGAAAELDAVVENASRSDPDWALCYRLAKLAGRTEDIERLLGPVRESMFEPAMPALIDAETSLKDGEIDAGLAGCYQALMYDPVPGTRMKLINYLLENGHAAEALMLLDAFRQGGLSASGEEQLSELLGLDGKELLAFYPRLVDAAVTAGEFDLAADYEGQRVELAERLKVETQDRRAEIEKQKQAAAGPQSPIVIVDEIAN